MPLNLLKPLAPTTIKKEYSPKEFIKLAGQKPHLIKRSMYIHARVGSGNRGKFIVEFENFNTTESTSEYF